MATRKFDIVPDQSEINALDRDLRFYPAQVEDPAVLTQEQIAQFNQDGYLKGLSIFGSDEIDSIRSYFDALLERTLAQGGDSISFDPLSTWACLLARRHNRQWPALSLAIMPYRVRNTSSSLSADTLDPNERKLFSEALWAKPMHNKLRCLHHYS